MIEATASPSQFLSPREVETKTTLSRTTLWRKVKEGSFPKPKKISANRIAWSASDLAAWEASCGEAA